MGRHRSPVAELDQHEADRARRRALELVAELDTIIADTGVLTTGREMSLWRWAGSASVILKELARG